MLTDTEELAFASVARQAELVRAGEVSARELTERQLERIDRLDPTINAFRVVRAERALEEARTAQDRLRAGDEAPLLGVPIAVKDNVDVTGELTTHGTGVVTTPATADSEAVRRLRAAGAVRAADRGVAQADAADKARSRSPRGRRGHGAAAALARPRGPRARPRLR